MLKENYAAHAQSIYLTHS